jgi:hypothetical protein
MKTASPYLENLLHISAKAFDAGIDEHLEEESMSKQPHIGYPLVISSNEAEFDALLKEASWLLRKSSQRTLELFNRVFDSLYTAGKLISIDVDRSTTNACELRILFEPTNCLKNLMAALRAGNIENFAVEIGRQINITIICSDGYEAIVKKKLVSKPNGIISEDINLYVCPIESASSSNVDQDSGRQNSFDNRPIGE